MGDLFRPNVSAPPPPPPPPDANKDPDVARKLEEAAAAERKAKGRAATMLTDSSQESQSANVARQTLLGS